MAGTPLVRKLGIGEGDRVAVLEDPGHVDTLLEGLPTGTRVEVEPAIPPSADGPGGRSREVVLLFCRDRSVLEARLEEAVRLLTWAGGLWICWPKGSSPLASDIDREAVRERGLATGLVDTKVCAVDGDWSGLRFVHRVAERP